MDVYVPSKAILSYLFKMMSNMQCFKKHSTLGSGAQGVVSKYEVLQNFGVFLDEPQILPKFVAIKRIKPTEDNAGISREALREIKILTELCHPNVMQIFDTFAHRGSKFQMLFLECFLTLEISTMKK